MSKRVRLTNDGLNSYGSRVLTAGLQTEQYIRNPVLLYMHQRGTVIGYLKDIEVTGDEITAELVFDEATELSKSCKKQWEVGSLRMVSIGIDILEMSEEPEFLLQGQTRPTITKSKLFEVSLVDIGSNDDAIRLWKDGHEIKLGKDGECLLPLINKPQNYNQMELKTIALLLGLAETATEAAVTGAIKTLMAEKTNAENKVAQLTKEKEQLQLAAITQVVDTAIAEKRFGLDKKETFINLGKTAGIDELKNIVSAIAPQAKLSAVITSKGGKTQAAPVTYSKLSEVPVDALLEMREEDPEQYKRLYKAEYGMECEL